ncbi:MAG: hypothetical protein V4638_08980 [Bacteroidota bacterium]
MSKVKFLLVSILVSQTFSSSAQLLSGDLVDEKRALVSTTDFKVQDPNSGEIFVLIAVNRLGEVTSAKIDLTATKVVSTPARIKAVAFAKKLKFQEGTYFPEFHHARIKVTLLQPETSN